MGTEMKTKTAIRIPVECHHCGQVAEVPEVWLGKPVECLFCGEAFRAIGTLPALPSVPVADPEAYDWIGGLIGGLIGTAVFWLWVLAWLLAR